MSEKTQPHPRTLPKDHPAAQAAADARKAEGAKKAPKAQKTTHPA